MKKIVSLIFSLIIFALLVPFAGAQAAKKQQNQGDAVQFSNDLNALIETAAEEKPYNGEPYIQLVDGGAKISGKITGVKGKVKYKSSNKKVFKVSKKGTITPIKPGNAILTATVGDMKYTCHVCVISRGLEYSDVYRWRDDRINAGVNGVSVLGIGDCTDKQIIIGAYDESGKNRIANIADDAFTDNENITTVNLTGSTIVEVDNAFNGCKNLKTIRFPKTLKAIECDFSDCIMLKKIELPESLKLLISEFNNSGITELNFPKNTKELAWIYYGPSIKKINTESFFVFLSLCDDSRDMNIEGDYRVIISYDGKEYHSLTGFLPPYTPYLMGYRDSGYVDTLTEKQRASLTVLKAVDFKPDTDSFNVRVLKANMIVNSLLSQVYYGADTTRSGIGENFSDTVYNKVGGIKSFVCGDYANLTSGIFSLFGLPTSTAMSTELNHRWHIIKSSSGEWLQVDNVSLKQSRVGVYIDEAISEIGGYETVRRYINNIIGYGGVINPNPFDVLENDNMDNLDNLFDTVAQTMLLEDYAIEENRITTPGWNFYEYPTYYSYCNDYCGWISSKWNKADERLNAFRKFAERTLEINEDGVYNYVDFKLNNCLENVPQEYLDLICKYLLSTIMRDADMFSLEKLNQKTKIGVGVSSEAVIVEKGDTF